MCKEAFETVQPIVVGCKMQTHMQRHNQVVGTVHRKICGKYGLEIPVVNVGDTSKHGKENDKAKIL